MPTHRPGRRFKAPEERYRLGGMESVDLASSGVQATCIPVIPALYQWLSPWRERGGTGCAEQRARTTVRREMMMLERGDHCSPATHEHALACCG